MPIKISAALRKIERKKNAEQIARQRVIELLGPTESRVD
jgi:hypothetical protein